MRRSLYLEHRGAARVRLGLTHDAAQGYLNVDLDPSRAHDFHVWIRSHWRSGTRSGHIPGREKGHEIRVKSDRVPAAARIPGDVSRQEEWTGYDRVCSIAYVVGIGSSVKPHTEGLVARDRFHARVVQLACYGLRRQ